MQEKKVTYQELARQAQKTEKHQIVLAIADGKIRELFQTAKEGEEISFLTTADRIGHDTWVRSAVMLLMKAASDVAGNLQKGKLKVEFSIGRGQVLPNDAGSPGGRRLGRRSGKCAAQKTSLGRKASAVGAD